MFESGDYISCWLVGGAIEIEIEIERERKRKEEEEEEEEEDEMRLAHTTLNV